MIDGEEFAKIWEESGLQHYYNQMDILVDAGFTFNDNGLMLEDQSDALEEWLDEIGKTILLITKEEVTKAFDSIMERSRVIETERYAELLRGH